MHVFIKRKDLKKKINSLGLSRQPKVRLCDRSVSVCRRTDYSLPTLYADGQSWALAFQGPQAMARFRHKSTSLLRIPSDRAILVSQNLS